MSWSGHPVPSRGMWPHGRVGDPNPTSTAGKCRFGHRRWDLSLHKSLYPSTSLYSSAGWWMHPRLQRQDRQRKPHNFKKKKFCVEIHQLGNSRLTLKQFDWLTVFFVLFCLGVFCFCCYLVHLLFQKKEIFIKKQQCILFYFLNNR